VTVEKERYLDMRAGKVLRRQKVAQTLGTASR
jgi:hypothetical protein